MPNSNQLFHSMASTTTPVFTVQMLQLAQMCRSTTNTDAIGSRFGFDRSMSNSAGASDVPRTYLLLLMPQCNVFSSLKRSSSDWILSRHTAFTFCIDLCYPCVLYLFASRTTLSSTYRDLFESHCARTR